MVRVVLPPYLTNIMKFSTDKSVERFLDISTSLQMRLVKHNNRYDLTVPMLKVSALPMATILTKVS